MRFWFSGPTSPSNIPELNTSESFYELNTFLFQSRESLDKMSTKEQQINQLLDMGFGNNRVVRALQATEFKVSRESTKDFQLKDF